MESVLTDLYTNKTPLTKKGEFKAAWRMKVATSNKQGDVQAMEIDLQAMEFGIPGYDDLV